MCSKLDRSTTDRFIVKFVKKASKSQIVAMLFLYSPAFFLDCAKD